LNFRAKQKKEATTDKPPTHPSKSVLDVDDNPWIRKGKVVL